MDDIKAKRIHDCIKHHINFISGTVTPCQSNKRKKDEENHISDIESLDIGIRYLYQMYEKYNKSLSLSIQPKFMGSRINMYLFNKDHLSKSYCVTRNGFKCYLPKDLMDKIIEVTHNRLKQFMEDNKIEMMILDGEMLPWSALGSGLIDNEFMPVDLGLKMEINLMEKYGFDDEMVILKHRMQKIHDIYIVDKKKAIEEFGVQMVKDYEKQWENIKLIHNTDVSKKLYDTYHAQMNLYAKAGNKQNDISYKPFGILKICYEDGSESIPLIDHTYKQSDMYQILADPECPDDQQLYITLTAETLDDTSAKIKIFFDTLTCEKGYEGIIIKPDLIMPDCLPMMKCRNTSYLTIIYGYDYMIEPKLTRLIHSKTTGRKIKQSINEFNLGMDMLKIKLKYLYNEDMGQSIDPRL
jgi:hypothetical protein